MRCAFCHRRNSLNPNRLTSKRNINRNFYNNTFICPCVCSNTLWRQIHIRQFLIITKIYHSNIITKSISHNRNHVTTFCICRKHTTNNRRVFFIQSSHNNSHRIALLTRCSHHNTLFPCSYRRNRRSNFSI